MHAAISPIINEETIELRNTALSKYFSRDIDQKPCKNIGNEITNTEGKNINIGNLTENKLSNIKKKVKSVKTKPTPLAALNKAIVLIADTV